MPKSRKGAPPPMPAPARQTAGPDSARPPWDRQPGESAKAFAAFECYKLMGPRRSVVKVAGEIGRHPSLIRRWCQRHHWVDRALAWDGAQAKEVEALLSHAREQALKRRVEAGEHVEKLGMLAIQSLITRDQETGKPRLDNRVRPRDAVALYRLALDIHKSLPQAMEIPSAAADRAEADRLQELSDEELRAVLDLLKQRSQPEVKDDEAADN